MAIKFYRVNDAYGCFSNFAKYGFYINDKFWKTSEHFFQAQKFKDTEYEEMIFSLESPMEAASPVWIHPLLPEHQPHRRSPYER